MANKRMFSKDIVGSDAFQDMPASSQLLYFHLGMEADDDGFIGNPKKIARSIGMAEDDMKILVAKKFVLLFQSGVLVIKHHRINNNWDKHNCKRTIYLEEFFQLYIKENKAYTMDKTQGIPVQSENSLKTVYRIEENRIDKKRIDKNKRNIYSDLTVAEKTPNEINLVFEVFSKINPTLNWGNKTTRMAAADLIKKFGLEATLKMAEQIVAVQGQPYAPVATTPYQMKEKLAQFKIYFDKEKGEEMIKV